MKVRLILLLGLLSYCLNVQSQTTYKEVLDRFVVDEQQEKVYLHLDKPQYAAGNDLWFKAYITSALTHLPTKVSSTLYVELINQESLIVDSLSLFIQEGATHGSFILETDLEPGLYQLRAYTEWMRNLGEDFFYRKKFMIINPILSADVKVIPNLRSYQNELKADFFPEGGDLIDSLTSRVAIKLKNGNHSKSQLEGVIINDSGKEIAKFETNHFGYGSFTIEPEIKSQYLAVIEEDTFQLPSVKKAGAAIKVLQRQNSNFIHIGIQARNIDLIGGTLVIHKRGQLLLSEKCLDKSSMAIRVDKVNLGVGIIHITFFDKNRIPLSERLIFPNPNENKPEVTITPDFKEYSKRSRISLDIRSGSTDTISSASITINPLMESSYEVYDENIKNYFLLNSDLKGKIEFPDYYFTGTKQAYRSLDLLMLTHGWSRFNWSSLMNSTNYPPKFLPEKGLKLRGRVADYYNEKTVDDYLLGVTIPSMGVINDTLLVNNEEGVFQISDLRFMDSTLVFMQVYKETNRKIKKYNRAEVHIEYPSRPAVEEFSKSKYLVKQEYVEKVKKLNQISEAYFLDDKTFKLDEVVVKGKKVNESDLNINTLYGQPSNRLIIDSLGASTALSIFDLLRQVPGLLILGSFPYEEISVRGAASLESEAGPAIILDGVMLDIDAIRYLPVEEIMLIDVLKGPRAFIYGARGANGVIAVYSRRGELRYSEQEPKPTGLLSFMHPGYHQAKEFYSPDYDDEEQKSSIPDYRTTLYWNPYVDFNNNTALETFYSSDQAGSYIIRIEGMLTDGRPFLKESFIEVE